MATSKFLTTFVRSPISVATSLYPALDSLSCRSIRHSDNFAKFSRNFSHEGRSFQHTQSNHCEASHSPRLSKSISQSWMLPSSGIGVPAISSSSSDALRHQYVCPSRMSQLFSQLVITDNLTDVKSYYDCPVASTINAEIITPTSRQRENAEMTEPPLWGQRDSPVQKEALEIMRIRHKKMKKHKLKKLRKRMYFLWKKQKATRKANRDAIYWQEISDIKQQADDFDPEIFVKEQLEKARKGGFYINVMGSNSKTN